MVTQGDQTEEQRRLAKRADGSIATGQPALPSQSELRQILAAESQRPPAPGKEDVHYPQFDAVVRLLEYYGLDSSLFQQPAKDVQAVMAAGKPLVTVATEKILAAPDRELLGAVYDYLCEEDTPRPSDLIMVFGSSTPLRAEKAAELYQQGLSKQILATGANPFYEAHTTTSEAEWYKEIMVARGVPAEGIITEAHSITIPDNVRSGLNLLDSMKLSVESIILVMSPFAMRRTHTTMKKYVPDSVALYRVNCASDHEHQRNTWYKEADSIKVFLNEFVKMKASVTYNSS